MASDASLDTSLLASEKRYKTQLGHAKANDVPLPKCEEAAANCVPFEQGTACATPADIFVLELQQQQPKAQPSIPNDIATSQAVPADRALPEDQLNPRFHDPQQLSLIVVTPDQLFEQPVCDSQQAGILAIMQQPDSGLTNPVQSTSPVSVGDHSPAHAPPAGFTEGNAAALPSNRNNVLVDSPAGPGVSSISKPLGAAHIKCSLASQAAGAAATASEPQSPPAEPTATSLVSQSAQSNSNFGSSAMPSSSKFCAALHTGIVAPADKLTSSQGNLVGTLLRPLATAEAALGAKVAGSTDEVHRVEVDTNDVFTVSSCALSDQACSGAPQTSSDPIPELGLPAVNNRSMTTLKYSAGAVPPTPDIISTSGSSMTQSAAAFNRGGVPEQVVPQLSHSTEDAPTGHAPAGIRPDIQSHVSAATCQRHLSGSAVHGQYVRGSGTACVTSMVPLMQGNAAQRPSAAAEPQQPTATDGGDLTDTDEILPVKRRDKPPPSPAYQNTQATTKDTLSNIFAPALLPLLDDDSVSSY
ncbi:TPA: hypothetical protein ACH3X1_013331 [Trebouxia sp. C0004]